MNGCFWHKHDCGRFVWPKSNIEYWRTKITRNVERDNANYIKLSEMGWNVIVLWECQLKKDTMTKTLDELSFQLKKSI